MTGRRQNYWRLMVVLVACARAALAFRLAPALPTRCAGMATASRYFASPSSSSPSSSSSVAAAATAITTAAGPTGKRRRVSTAATAGSSSSSRLSDSESAAEALASLGSHAEFVRALEGVRGDPLEDTGHRIVVYRGNPKARLMVIGEAPGETEDRLGKPFVGKAGQLLDQILQSVQFDVETDVYVSNIVRRRPPGNRNPLAGEVAFFKPWLLREIELVDPYILLLAGSFSMKAVLEGEKRGITKVRGEWFELPIGSTGGIDGKGLRLCMPIFHPSYLLRNQSRAVGGPKWLMWMDIQQVRKRYDALVGGDAATAGQGEGEEGKEQGPF